MKELTRAEEEIMQELWKLEEANVKQIIAQVKGKKPAYNTVSTIVRILVDKGFAGYRKQGRGHVYFPTVSKSEYSKFSLNKMKENYFEGSVKSMLSFFVKKNDLSLNDLEEIMTDLDKNKDYD